MPREQHVACLGSLQCSGRWLPRQISQSEPPGAALLFLQEQQQAMALCAAAKGGVLEPSAVAKRVSRRQACGLPLLV